MPRTPRCWFPGAWYHIIARGNGRQSIFLAQQDFERYLEELRRQTQRYGCRVHAFVLMSNHVHVMLETGERSPVECLRDIQRSYAVYFNARYDRIGHLFADRYRSILVDREAYAAELSRYIHLNPVRAGLVADPAAYPWSSFRSYAGLSDDGWTARDTVLTLVAGEGQGRQARYRQFVLDGVARPRDLLKEVRHDCLASKRFRLQAQLWALSTSTWHQ